MKFIYRILIVAVFSVLVCQPGYAASCPKALATIFSNEGGYQCMKNDSGNWTGGKVGKGQLKGTKFGIAAASYPKVDIKSLTINTAAMYYERDYWNPLLLTGLKSQGLATTILDTAVNCGTGTAAILVEKTCNILNGSGIDYPLNARITRGMVDWINGFTRPREQRVMFYLVFQALRSERYVAIAKADKRKHVYLDDWLIRTWE